MIARSTLSLGALGAVLASPAVAATGPFVSLRNTDFVVLLGFLLLGNATNLLLLSSGGPSGRAPILGYSDPEDMSDPLPQALILTAIVITFGIAAFLLALIYRSWRLVRQEVVGVDEEDRRVARRSATDADEIDPDDLAPEDRPAMHADTLSADDEAEAALARDYAGIPSDDVDLPPVRRETP